MSSEFGEKDKKAEGCRQQRMTQTLRIQFGVMSSPAPILSGEFGVNPVRNSSGALNPAGIILKCYPAAAAGPEGLWPGGSSEALFLTG